MKAILLLLAGILWQTANYAQQIKNEDLVYDDNILTVQLYRTGDKLSNPVIRLGSTDRLKLSFDDMSSETYLFRYTFVHCD
ncbi:MAG: DUF5103 domain-containing protein, partial [bacterium]